MDFRIFTPVIWTLWQCFRLRLCCDLHELEYGLEVRNLSLTIHNKEALLIWDCDVSMKDCINISYEIYQKLEDWDFVEDEKKGPKPMNPTQVCGKEIAVILKNGLSSTVCFQVVTVYNDVYQNDSEICLDQGRNETAENVDCMVYNTSSMKCSWNYSENVPYKTEYTLSLEQDTIIHCQQYMHDRERRTCSCFFHDLTINFKDAFIILKRNGSERHVFKDKIKLAEKGTKELVTPSCQFVHIVPGAITEEQNNAKYLNPPSNLTVIYMKENVILSWRRPHTQYNASDSCFKYQLEKNKELISDVSNPPFHSNLENECWVRIRAKGDGCGMTANWGRWSEEISCGAPQEAPDITEFIVLITLLGLAGVIILLTIIMGIYYKRISRLVFPRIPQPKNYFDEIQDYNTKQLQKLI